MEKTINIDLEQVSRDCGLPLNQIEKTVELLDQGNTVPFITRYRKDWTGGLDEEQIRCIQEIVERLRMLADRKQAILRSIDSQGKLTPEMAGQIKSAHSIKRLEDLYLPYKPHKQTLATKARERGLEPLAREVLEADPMAADLEKRAADFVDPDKGLNNTAEVLLGVGHLLAETFGERADLRGRVRKIFRRTGKLITTQIDPKTRNTEQHSEGEHGSEQPATTTKTPPADAPTETPDAAPAKEAPAIETTQATESVEIKDVTAQPPAVEGEVTAAAPVETPASEPAETETATTEATETETPDTTAEPSTEQPPATPVETMPSVAKVATETPTEEAPPTEPAPSTEETPTTETTPAEEASKEPESDEAAAAEKAKADAAAAEKAKADAAKAKKAAADAARKEARAAAKAKAKEAARKLKEEAKKRRQKQKEAAFKDYFGYEEALTQAPPHRILAINRGKRARVLRVKIEADNQQMREEAEKLLVSEEHPHADFLRECVRDVLNRIIFPGLDREARRELTEKAELHAVEVFARNLRKLLLQPPVHGHRVMAIDPGFRSGCKLAAIDEFGNVLGHGVIYLVGKDDRRKRSRARLAEMIRLHNLSLIAIGNGTACRETEQLVADLIANELKDMDIAYVIVNEAGASVYSTSPLGREEFPEYDPTLRSAISIARRLLDPLSELVKITPANIGVGLYQHDLKAKHLQSSLDAVVESCVNFVGVDLNTASPELLRYVSGLNQLTARRIFDYRQENGPFKERRQLVDVPGVGASTFVQAAGFLKIAGGDNALDATWIHPESYDAASTVLEKLDSSVNELAAVLKVPTSEEQPKEVAAKAPESVEPPAAEVAASETEASPAPTEAEASAAAETPVEGTVEPATDAPAAEATLTEQEPVAEAEKALPSAEESVEVPTDAPVASAPAADTPAADTPAADTPAAKPPAEPTPATPPTAVPKPILIPGLEEKLANVNAAEMASELGIGELTLRDIFSALARPGRDPREDLSPSMFRRGVMKLDDLEPEMELVGTVLNVVDFGAFVDIGLHDTGLIHISRLADRYVRDPHEVISVGDIVRVWVVGIDKQRRRVSLTAIKPGTEHKPRERGPRRPRSEEGEGGAAPHRRSEDRPRGEGDGDRRRGGRQPRRDDRRGGRDRHGQGRTRGFVAKPRKPKPVTPITTEMVKGEEPMRSFSDLKQLFEKRTPSKKDTKKNTPKKQDNNSDKPEEKKDE